MSTPQVHLAYAPRGVGLAYAVVYLKKDPDICGWWIGAIGADVASAYFRLENFYTRAATALHPTDGSDLYGGSRPESPSRSVPFLWSPIWRTNSSRRRTLSPPSGWCSRRTAMRTVRPKPTVMPNFPMGGSTSVSRN